MRHFWTGWKRVLQYCIRVCSRARQDPAALAPKQVSDLIVETAPYLEDFIGHLFGIESELRELQAQHSALAPLYSVKRRFVQRKALTGYTPEKANEIDGPSVALELEAIMHEPLTEKSFAEHVARWLDSGNRTYRSYSARHALCRMGHTLDRRKNPACAWRFVQTAAQARHASPDSG